MKRRKSSDAQRRERMIMITGSVLVLTAMTVTGISLYQNNRSEKQEENIVDFSALEDENTLEGSAAQAQSPEVENYTSQKDMGELDYDPYYAAKDELLNREGSGTGAEDKQEEPGQEGSGAAGDGRPETDASGEQAAAENGSVGYAEISNGEVTAEGTMENAPNKTEAAAEEVISDTVTDEAAADPQTEALEAVANAVQEEQRLYFDETAKLMWPLVGNVVLNYSMDKTVYFQTLQQYKYNPSIVVSAAQGSNVACAADGVVKSIYEDPQTGLTLVMNLGNGYELTYGQLTDLMVEEGELVEAGVFIGKVAAPTKYYTREGTNLYLKLTRDQEPVDPLDYLG